VFADRFRLRDLLVQEGLDPWPKTTDGKGLHVMVSYRTKNGWNPAHEYTREIAGASGHGSAQLVE
jgi:DNA primase